MNKFLLTLPVLAAALVMAERGAHAFTLDNNGASSSIGSTLLHPDEATESSGNGGTAGGSSSTRLHFGVGSSYGPGPMNRSNSPPAWVGNPLFLDKGSSQRDQ